MSWPVIDAIPLFPEVDAALLNLLRGMDDEDWKRPTIAGAWTVRDVVAHLLDTALRRLSFARDGWFPPMTLQRPEDLVTIIDAANAQGVQAFGRLSPRVLIGLMEVTTRDLHAYLQSLDPNGRAPFAVSWAGEDESQNWFDIARELTERWHHQAQIRLAVGRWDGFLTRRLYHPVLDCFLRALPFRYRDLTAPEGHQVQVVVDGDAGGEWTLERSGDAWRPVASAEPARVAARAVIPGEIAWRVFTKGIDRAEAERRSSLHGDRRLAARVFELTAIVG
jgi:uncharacterized protein (TIGR03083 family)